jgi:large subunit ribosomal protein L6
MSRIGKAPITIPKGIEISVADNNVVTVKGPKGTLSEKINSDLTVTVEGTELVVSRPTEQKRHKAMHGLYRSLINNMVVGVSEGFKKELELVGVGFRATNTGQLLELAVGYSHPVFLYLPNEVKVETVTEKGKSPVIKLESIDKQLIGQIAAKIKSIRKSEPYKGKGIKFVDEVLRRKAGKTSAK